MVALLGRRRERLAMFAPVFWRPATGASEAHRAFIEYLLSDGGAKAYRTEESFLMAVPRAAGWLVDDAHVPGEDWAGDDGRALWNAFDADCHGADVRVVCPTYEGARAEFARAAGLSVSETWWLLELPGGSGGRPGLRVQLPGAAAITVAAPPVYDPLGPVLFPPSWSTSSRAATPSVKRSPRPDSGGIAPTTPAPLRPSDEAPVQHRPSARPRGSRPWAGGLRWEKSGRPGEGEAAGGSRPVTVR
jgi:hypothetical protein